MRAGEEAERTYGGVRVRFTPSDVPVLTCFPVDRRRRCAGPEALARRSGRPRRLRRGEPAGGAPDGSAAAVEQLAAGRAVENALRGGCGTVRLPPR
ncbi:hypothetical protein MRQ36_32000 [Micromonospora sp. R77]|uniref:hypothetical protein n=1 Tax=Micromonospora sp. R77 TaxID=2925836 RepID=UPI001F62123A|nr:hypothetical protein [Micromonospora sp. R77]MCI4066938.1 hypothetical protein [Micromonospora sp. R77]